MRTHAISVGGGAYDGDIQCMVFDEKILDVAAVGVSGVGFVVIFCAK